MIRLQCTCGKEFQIPDEFRGRQGRCPNCSNIIMVPHNTNDIPSFDELAPRQRLFNTQELFEHVIESVVGIAHEGDIFGSGVLIDEKGVVVTNHHVVGKSKKVTVVLNDGAEYIGETIRSYRDIDLAFLQLMSRPDKYAPLGDQASLKVGQTIYAIGHPLGLQNTITKGIVSALNRVIKEKKYIQTDASINPGNSGGPLFNEYAEVVGINTMVLRDTQGLGFAIPVETVVERYADIQQNYSALVSQEYCGICGKNSNDFKYCEFCGVELNPDRPSKRRPPEPMNLPAHIETRSCKVCNTLVPIAERYCYNCGIKMPLKRLLRKR
jgi:serine protease Do